MVKYRRKVFFNKISQYAKDIFVRICSSYNITLEEWNHDQDHVHIMFRAHPNTEYQNSSMPTKVLAPG